MNETAEREYAGKLIAKYQPRLKAFIRKHVYNREDAEDILQDVLYQMLKAIDNTLNPVVQLEAWLYRVAKNAIINHGTKKREEKLPSYSNDDSDEDDILKDFSEVLFNSEAASPETEYLRSLVWTELENTLAEMPPEQRQIYELTEVDGIPVREISQMTGVPVNTLLSRKHYAILFLRKRMKQLYEDIIFS